MMLTALALRRRASCETGDKKTLYIMLCLGATSGERVSFSLISLQALSRASARAKGNTGGCVISVDFGLRLARQSPPEARRRRMCFVSQVAAATVAVISLGALRRRLSRRKEINGTGRLSPNVTQLRPCVCRIQFNANSAGRESAAAT
jgi:hypothetical protein